MQKMASLLPHSGVQSVSAICTPAFIISSTTPPPSPSAPPLLLLFLLRLYYPSCSNTTNTSFIATATTTSSGWQPSPLAFICLFLSLVEPHSISLVGLPLHLRSTHSLSLSLAFSFTLSPSPSLTRVLSSQRSALINAVFSWSSILIFVPHLFLADCLSSPAFLSSCFLSL